MAIVKIFGNLRTLAGKSSLMLDGNTVSDLLIEMGKQNEKLLYSVLSKEGIRPYFKILVNGHDIFLVQGLSTPVQPNDIVAIFPPIAGGGRLKGSILWL